MYKYLCSIYLIFITLNINAQSESEAIQQIREQYATYNSNLEKYNIIAFVALFDTGGKGLVPIKNDFLDYDIGKCFTHSTERDISFYFENGELRLIIDAEYDPVEAAYSRTREYYVKDKQIYFFYEIFDEINWWAQETEGEFPMKRCEIRKYYSAKKLLRYLRKEVETSTGVDIKTVSHGIPSIEMPLENENVLKDYSALLELIYPMWLD